MAEPDVPSTPQAQQLHQMAQQGDAAKAAQLLASAPALARARDERGRTPLHVAAGHGHDETAALLRRHRAG